MINKLKTFVRQRILAGNIPEGKAGISIIGHKNYVGGAWDEIGKHQFDFLVSQGLKQNDVFLDVGCGAFRGGRFFMDYLDQGNYLGIDKELELVKRGVDAELGWEMYLEKNPQLVLSEDFEFEKFEKKAMYSLALSVFTHLNKPDINLCLKKLRAYVPTGHKFFVSFYEGNSQTNSGKSHSLNHVEYSKEEMEAFGTENGWKPCYIGDWKHPRNHMMMMYEA